jgi:hypothetical protein
MANLFKPSHKHIEPDHDMMSRQSVQRRIVTRAGFRGARKRTGSAISQL